MAYILVEDDVIIQKQPYCEEGFIEAPDEVICGMVKQDDEFVSPLPVVEQPEL